MAGQGKRKKLSQPHCNMLTLTFFIVVVCDSEHNMNTQSTSLQVKAKMSCKRAAPTPKRYLVKALTQYV